jgi:hypothetical protein
MAQEIPQFFLHFIILGDEKGWQEKPKGIALGVEIEMTNLE